MFKTAVFTNLTQDHLDYHKDMEDYFAAKKMLFDVCDTALLNIDDSYGRRLCDEVNCNKLTFSVKEKADFCREWGLGQSRGGIWENSTVYNEKSGDCVSLPKVCRKNIFVSGAG